MTLVSNGLLVVSGLTAGGLGVVAWHNRRQPGTSALAAFLFLIALWTGAHLLEHATTGWLDVFFEKLTWSAILPAAFVWFAFVLAYVGYEVRKPRWRLAVLLGWPAAVVVALWLPADIAGPLAVWAQFDAESGLVYWASFAGAYALLAVGSALLVRRLLRMQGQFRAQAAAILLGVAAAWAGSVVSAFELFGEYHFHALPVGFTLLGGFLLWGVARTGLTDIAPVATRTVLETLSAGVVVVDADHRILLSNPAARRQLGVPAATDSVGQSLAAFGDAGTTLEAWLASADGPAAPETRTLERDGAVLKVEGAPISDPADGVGGWVLVLSDITDQRSRQQRLEDRNERLDEFASIVSHDLRNPLAVATTRLELARDEVESSHLADVAGALERMDDLIEDLLTLTRDRDALDPQPLDLATVAERTWQHVPTDDADLATTAVTIEADARQLQQLLENLFRNAVEHGGAGVTITVGPIDDGFVVEDDGVGLADDAAAILETGYSTAASGTGLGLNVVERVAEVHGWDLTVTDSADGGARFEFTGVPRGDRERGAHTRTPAKDDA